MSLFPSISAEVIENLCFDLEFITMYDEYLSTFSNDTTGNEATVCGISCTFLKLYLDAAACIRCFLPGTGGAT